MTVDRKRRDTSSIEEEDEGSNTSMDDVEDESTDAVDDWLKYYSTTAEGLLEDFTRIL